MTVAQTILNQLGGNKFIAMTGSKNLTSDGNTLNMRLAGNRSGANHLKITLNGLDTYDMEFIKYIKAKVKIDTTNKAVSYTPDKLIAIKSLDNVHCDQLQEIFTGVTGLETHL